ncbi:MAG: dockerin type I domain-containing protein [Chthoniobacterales bacterium]
MKKRSNAQAAFFNLRTLFGLAISLTGVSLAFIGFAASPAAPTQARPATPISTRPGAAEVHRIVGPVSLNRDLRTLRYMPQSGESEEDVRLTRHPRRLGGVPEKFNPVKAVRQAMQPSTMPAPIATYAGIGRANSGCSCLPPDTNGDVGPNHYIQAVNVSFTILDKSGNTLVGPTTYNSLFSLMGATPCGLNQNQGDPVVFYDHMADRWVISDFAFPSFPGVSFYQCVAVSKTSDPVAGGWWLYAVQVDPANPTFLGDYPKFGLWPDAYYFAVNQFSNNTTFNGFRVFALDRNSMINGGPANTVAFSVDATNAGDTYSLVPATFRTGSPPPTGRDQFFVSVDSPSFGGITLTQVHAWKFHVDFVNPANSTFGVGPNHQPNAQITVNGFVDAFTNTTSNLVPQPGTSAKLDTLGDKIMYPLVYQNLSGAESLWADQTIMLNYPNGPTAVRWYQFDVTGGNFPATPVRQQDWTNGGDGLFRWMPSIAVDAQGNAVIGYSASSSAVSASIRYAGRLATDPSNNLGQGEAIMINGGGSQTSSSGRWGDYSMTGVDPADGMTFWHTHEYYTATSSSTWATRIGKFRFAQPLTLSSAVSRKVCGGAGTFDISLPGIECRTGDYSIVVTCSNNVVSGNAAVTSGVGTVSEPPVLSGNTMTINLTGVANVQTLTVTLSNVMDTFGQTLSDTGVTMSVLIGDTNGNGTVNAADVAQTKAQLGQAVTGSNFRTDVNANGTVNAADAALVKQHSGEGLP